jgi:hypothetical protein
MIRDLYITEIKPSMRNVLNAAETISCTTDMWTTTGKPMSFAAVTVHFVNKSTRKIDHMCLTIEEVKGVRPFIPPLPSPLSPSPFPSPNHTILLLFVRAIGSHSATNLSSFLLRCLDGWDVTSKLFAVTADGAAAQQKALRAVGESVIIWPLWCAAHRLNLIVQSALQIKVCTILDL